MLRCRNYFRPHPNLRIRANGEVSLCPLVDAGEGYGNIHAMGFVEVVNRMQEAFAYRLHAEGRLGEYRHYMDRTLFGEQIGHVCSLRAVLILIARELEERCVSSTDARAIREINVEVARRTGFLHQPR